MIGQQVLFSHKTDHWSTPSDFYRQLDREFQFTMDPCPLNSKECGLTKPWSGAVFCNPPYSDIRRWLEKGIEEVKAGRVDVVVFLVPARTDTAWFHELEMHNKYRGQFFTPYHLSVACAKMTLTGMEERQGVITVHEPACGSGSMVIACCEVAREMGINYQYRMFFDAQDIDRNCFNMAYIQLALLAVPARVNLGDTF